MTYVLRTFYTIVLIFILVLIARVDKKENKLGKIVRICLACGEITFALDALALFFRDEFISTLFYGLFSTSVTVVLIAIWYFMTFYTNHPKFRKQSLIIMLSAAVAELGIFVSNAWFHESFKVASIQFPDGTDAHKIGASTPLYHVHILICYLIVICIFSQLISRLRTSPALYRKRYTGIIITFVIVLLLDAGGMFITALAGFSQLSYALLAISLYENAIVFAPKTLAAGLLSEVSRDLETGIVIYDLDSRMIYANDLAEVAFDHRVLGDVKIEDFGKQWINDRNPEIVEDVGWTQDTEDGTSLHYEIYFTRIFDKNNRLIGYYFTLQDRTAAVNNFATEKYRATHDDLTGLYNASGFYEEVRNILEKEPDIPRLIVVSNIKDFKLMNDLFGEARGDKVLRRIANVMSQKCVDNDSIPARLQSDRFAICMRKDRYSDELFTELPQQVIQLEENHLYKVVCHVGVYEITEPQLSVSTMCDRAFFALNTLKNSYTSLIAHYDSSLRDKILKEQEIIGSLQEALKNGEFQIYIQPQVQAKDFSCKGGEALVRWVKPTGIVPPNDFIPIFERTGLITNLDKYVWELACEKLRQWKSMGLNDYYISVNISPRDFYFVDIYDTFTSLVEKYRISPTNLHLEITESAVMKDAKKQIALINSLRAYGFHMEMDDFGSGYSSLNMLKNITMDVLKIDMGFLGEVQAHKAERSRSILKMIISLSKDLNMTVVSEGVETQEEVNFLKDMGVDVFQGYFFSKPIPLGEFEDKYVPL